MIPKECRRLAEVDFPIAEVSRHVARGSAAGRQAQPEQTGLQLQERIKVSARLDWHKIAKVANYGLEVNAMTQRMQMRDGAPPSGEKR